MSNEARIYKVTPANGAPVFVKAASQAQALRHVAKSAYTVSVPSALEVADGIAAGVKVEDAAPADADAAPENAPPQAGDQKQWPFPVGDQKAA